MAFRRDTAWPDVYLKIWTWFPAVGRTERSKRQIPACSATGWKEDQSRTLKTANEKLYKDHIWTIFSAVNTFITLDGWWKKTQFLLNYCVNSENVWEFSPLKASYEKQARSRFPFMGELFQGFLFVSLMFLKHPQSFAPRRTEDGLKLRKGMFKSD